MGGKGSGRKEKKLSKVLKEVIEEIGEVDDCIDEPVLNQKLGNLISRLCYHIYKLEREGL